jgi:hypothetical protein
MAATLVEEGMEHRPLKQVDVCLPLVGEHERT